MNYYWFFRQFYHNLRVVSDLKLNGIIILFSLMCTLLILLTLREKKNLISVPEKLIPVCDWTFQAEKVNLSLQLKFYTVQVKISLGLTLVFQMHRFLTWHRKLGDLLCFAYKSSFFSNHIRRLWSMKVFHANDCLSLKFMFKLKLLKPNYLATLYAFMKIFTFFFYSILKTISKTYIFEEIIVRDMSQNTGQ